MDEDTTTLPGFAGELPTEPLAEEPKLEPKPKAKRAPRAAAKKPVPEESAPTEAVDTAGEVSLTKIPASQRKFQKGT